MDWKVKRYNSFMQMGELGRRADLSTKTIRYYEEIGLEFIKAAQAASLSLGEIREILAFRDRGETPCGHVTQLMKQKVRTRCPSTSVA